MAKKKYEVSSELKTKVALYNQSKANYDQAWEYFSTTYAEQIAYLDKLREDVNVRATEIKNDCRAEAENVDIEVYGKSFSIGPFTVQKGESYWYDPKRFIEMVTEVGLLVEANEAGVIKQEVTVDKGAAEAFCTERDLGTRLERCKEIKQTTPAVKGVKTITGFNEEV